MHSNGVIYNACVSADIR